MILERLSRPVEKPAEVPLEEQNEGRSSPPAGPVVDLRSPLPATEELVDEGKRIADELAESYPKSPQALGLAGQIDQAFGRWSKAVERWQKCVKQDPRCAAAYAMLGEATLKQGEYDVAEEYLEKAAVLDPKLPNVDMLRAQAAMNFGKADEVIAILEKADSRVPLTPFGRVVFGKRTSSRRITLRRKGNLSWPWLPIPA